MVILYRMRNLGLCHFQAFAFHKVVQQDIEGVVEIFIEILLEISSHF